MLTVDQLIDTWVEMWNTYDLSVIDSLFLNDPSISYFSSEKEGSITGIQSVKEHHQHFGFILGGKSSDNKLWLEEIQKSEFGPVSIISALWYFKKPDKPVQRGPVSFVCHQTPEGYRFVHLHFATYIKRG